MLAAVEHADQRLAHLGIAILAFEHDAGDPAHGLLLHGADKTTKVAKTTPPINTSELIFTEGIGL
jgi:hypothetical protein